ncbi:MAG: hypothetical protein ACYTGN_01835 [Planctomycetota bacterium]|jgi:hypothetical protein
MLDGFYVHHPGDTTKMYTPEFAREGQAANFVADIIAVHGTVSFIITAEHRNREDTTRTTAATFSAISGTGVAQRGAESLKELIRFAFHFTSGTAGDFVYLALSSVGWREYN